MDRGLRLLSVEVVLEFLTVGGLVLGSVVHLDRVDADPGAVAGAHLVRHDQDEVGVGDLSDAEGSET